MAVVLPAPGESPWGEKLNAALRQVEGQISDLAETVSNLTPGSGGGGDGGGGDVFADSAARRLLQFPGKVFSSDAGGATIQFWNTSGEAWDGWWSEQTYYDPSPAVSDPGDLASMFRGGVSTAGSRDSVDGAYNSMSVGTNSPWSCGVRLHNVTRCMFIVATNVSEAPEGEAIGTDFAIQINGVWVTERPIASGIYNVPGEASAITFDWEEPQPQVDIRVYTRAGFQMIVADPDAYVSGMPNPGRIVEPAPRVAILGDSWIEGKPTGGQLPSVTDMLAMYSGWDVCVNGQGGTGYTNPGPVENQAWAGVYGDTDRVAAIAGCSPDAWVVFGTGNDFGADHEDLAEAAADLYAALGVALPGVPGVVIGPPFPDPAPVDGETVTDVLRTAAESAPNVMAFIDPVAEGWVVDGVLADDGVHTTVQGSEHIATHLHAAIRDALVRAGYQQW